MIPLFPRRHQSVFKKAAESINMATNKAEATVVKLYYSMLLVAAFAIVL
jgi:hypothetical protein